MLTQNQYFKTECRFGILTNRIDSHRRSPLSIAHTLSPSLSHVEPNSQFPTSNTNQVLSRSPCLSIRRLLSIYSTVISNFRRTKFVVLAFLCAKIHWWAKKSLILRHQLRWISCNRAHLPLYSYSCLKSIEIMRYGERRLLSEYCHTDTVNGNELWVSSDYR